MDSGKGGVEVQVMGLSFSVLLFLFLFFSVELTLLFIDNWPEKKYKNTNSVSAFGRL
jgi:hypothetical protein